MLLKALEGVVSAITQNYILILNFKLIVLNFSSFQTVLPGIENKSFTGKNYINAAELKQNMETKLKNYNQVIHSVLRIENSVSIGM